MFESAGLPLRNGNFERIVRALSDRLITLSGIKHEHTLYPSPLVPQPLLETSGYVTNFPQLIGGVVSLNPDPPSTTDSMLARADDKSAAWHSIAEPSDVYLTPAACYYAYNMLEGKELDEPIDLALMATCYRDEPSMDPMRMRSFRMQEFVVVGDEESCSTHTSLWLERAETFLLSLGLATSIEIATDPFFGRLNQLTASTQAAKEQKHERIWTDHSGSETALMSVNSHEQHFTGPMGIHNMDGSIAHSACAAFGLDRIAIALKMTYGPDLSEWPSSVKSMLALYNSSPQMMELHLR